MKSNAKNSHSRRNNRKAEIIKLATKNRSENIGCCEEITKNALKRDR